MEAVTIESLAKAIDGKVLKGDASKEIHKVIIDSRQDGTGGVFFAIKGEATDGHLYIDQAVENNVTAIVVHNDLEIDKVNTAVIKVTDTTQALLDFAGYYKSLFNIPVVAITGSCGKTTTKDIIASVLSQKFNTLKTRGNYNNQTGLPQNIFNLNSSHQMAVLEMGMSNFGEIYNMAKRVKPDIAVITNIGYSHIEYLKSRENILKAKTEILSFFNEKNIAVINGDDDYLKNISSDNYKIYKVGVHAGDIKVEGIRQIKSGIEFNVGDEKYCFPLIGIHNVYNCLYAITIAKIYGLSHSQIQAGFDAFKPSANRMDIKEHNGYTIINDAYNSNPAAAKAALDVLKNIDKQGRKIAVLADMLELGQFSKSLHEEIGKYAANCEIDMLITIGKEAQYIFTSAKEAGVANAEYFTDNKSASNYIQSIIRPGDIILFKGSRGMRLEQIINNIYSKEN